MSAPVITGLGAVTCLGHSVSELWAALAGAVPPDPSYTADSRYGSEGGGRAGALASDAVGQAVADARLTTSDLRGAGLVLGTTLGDIDRFEDEHAAPPEAGPYRLGERIAAEFGIGGPNHSVSTACSSGALAVGTAADLIAAGAAEIVIVCGSDCHSTVSRGMLERLDLLDPAACRPFDADRGGMVPGEGAAAVVLESAESARGRQARRYATVTGNEWSADAHHPTAPEPEGDQFRRAMAQAVRGSGGEPGAVLPHRAGIPMNDVVETAAVAGLLGPAAARIPAYGIKAMTGHTAGAAGVLACVVGALILGAGVVPPNANVGTPDPDCELFVPTAGPTELPAPRVLVTATGFGGSNVALVLGAAG
ncbi:beta-ketoacyl-[acyl-carrier-protein] synthase family protein [Amycolatopsis aidingensis]|uniref:beta-ketoacyl-[acyl-carrier-protein] synthase family protein n=1 Tax=Amycolatopsis aidingensis TaxID=2842453 RepID=UPI001C0D0140|nr:beta-ketoacyl synthase N-terminal-like domain-containing protein [Amycolatopsis aidingensis]